MTGFFFFFVCVGPVRHPNSPKRLGVGIFGSGRSKSGIFEASSETQVAKVWPPMVRSQKKVLFFGQSRLYNDFGLKTGIGCAHLDPVGVRWWLENTRF